MRFKSNYPVCCRAGSVRCLSGKQIKFALMLQPVGRGCFPDWLPLGFFDRTRRSKNSA